MKIASVISPDRVSISAFLSFMRYCFGRGYVFGELHNLMTSEEITKYIIDLTGIRDLIIFSYYAKKAMNMDPIQVIPAKLMEVSDLVVWMDLYSMDWKIIKDQGNESGPLLARWQANMKKMST